MFPKFSLGIPHPLSSRSKHIFLSRQYVRRIIFGYSDRLVAWIEFCIRLISACSIIPASASKSGTPGLSSLINSIFLRSFFSRLRTRSILSLILKNSCLGSWSLAKATRFLVKFFTRMVCLNINSSVFLVSSSLQSISKSSVFPIIMPKILLKSWAIFPATCPTKANFFCSLAIFWAFIFSFSAFLSSVTLWTTTLEPVNFPFS